MAKLTIINRKQFTEYDDQSFPNEQVNQLQHKYLLKPLIS